MLKCLTCGGIYAAIGPDGLRYFHACAPVLNAKGDGYDPRPNARDENIDLAKDAAARDAKGERRKGTRDEDLMKSAGAGVVDI